MGKIIEHEHIGSRETILFNPEITIEEGIITILPHTVYIRGQEFKLDTQTFESPDSVWFNFENHTLEEKELRPGAFRFLQKHFDEYHVIKYLELSSVTEIPMGKIPTKEVPVKKIPKVGIWKRLKKIVGR